MATKKNPLVTLHDAFVNYRHVRCNACDFDEESDALKCKPKFLLQKHLMFMVLYPKYNCETCQKQCSVVECGYAAEKVSTTISILQYFKKPPIVTLYGVSEFVRLYLAVSLLENASRMFTGPFHGKPDEHIHHDLTETLLKWKLDRQKKMYDYLDEVCRQQHIYKILTKTWQNRSLAPGSSPTV
jgi:hypothetical protein